MTLGRWLGLLGVASALYILWQIRQLVLLVFAAVVLATALNSLIRRFQNLGLKRGRAILITLALLLLVLTIFVALIVPPFINQFQELIRLAPRGISQIRAVVPGVIDWIKSWIPQGFTQGLDFLDLLKSLIQNGTAPSTYGPSLGGSLGGNLGLGVDFSQLPQQLTPLVRNFFAFFNNALGATLQCLFVAILTLMFLANPSDYRQALLVMFPSFYRRRADQVLERCETALINWFSGMLISSSGIAIMSGTGLALLGIDLALAHALLAGVLNLIPNIGPTLSMVFPISVALLGPTWKVGAVVILYFAVQNIESYLLTPTVMAHQVALLPAITLVAQIFFASNFGVLGLLLALPLTVVANIWIQEWLIKDVLDQAQAPASLSHPTAPIPPLLPARFTPDSSPAAIELDESLAHSPALDAEVEPSPSEIPPTP